MNILLTIREEIVCLIILGFFFVYYMIYRGETKDNRFIKMFCYAITHAALDLTTVITVNHLDEVPDWVNRVLHWLFYLAAIMFCYEMFCYITDLAYSRRMARRFSQIALALPVAFAVLMPFLRIDYVNGNGTNYSFGPCVFMGYGCALVLVFASFAVLITRYRRLNVNVRRTILPMVGFMLLAILVQVLLPELLFTGAGATLVMVGVFFAVENPAEKFRFQAFVDADTQVKNRNCFDADIQSYIRICRDRPQSFSCVACDINNLKVINDTLGHHVGDEAIRATARIMARELKSASGVYRVGGDEFSAVYLNVDEDTVAAEAAALKRAASEVLVAEGVNLRIAVGFATSEDGGQIHRAVGDADIRMYDDKYRSKTHKADLA